MSGTINFRQAIPSDIPRLIDLMNSQYVRKKGEAYFLWQYFNAYYPTVLFCAFDKTQLVGMFGFSEAAVAQWSDCRTSDRHACGS